MNPFKSHIIILNLLLLPAGYINGQSKPEANFMKARAFIKAEVYDSALVYLDKSLKITENNKDALLDKATALFNMHQYNRCLEVVKTLEKYDKAIGAMLSAKSYARIHDVDNCLTSLAVHLNSNYKYPESMIMLDRDFNVFESNPKWVSFWKEGNWYTAFDRTLAEADFLIKTKKYTEAINFLTEALSKGYRKSPIYSRRAKAYISLNNEKLALSDLDLAIDGDSRNSDLYSERAKINFTLGNYRKSLDDFNNAVRLNPADPLLYMNRALASNKNGLYEEALSDIDFYLNLFPQNDSAWYYKGIIHQDHENYMDALSCFSRSLTLNPADPRYYASRGTAYLNARTYKYAWRDLSMSLDLDPGNPEVYLSKGIAAVNLGDMNDACFCFRKAKELGNTRADSFIEKYCK